MRNSNGAGTIRCEPDYVGSTKKKCTIPIKLGAKGHLFCYYLDEALGSRATAGMIKRKNAKN